ncbi:MAG TPA: hypothetical protein ENH34_02605 [Phycisphaerales bacterium]|nr:hypothetical protein [Phycisphaerales bacterium]
MAKKEVLPARKFNPWARVSDEISQGPSLRKDLIDKIEKQLNAKVILFFTSFNNEEAMITDNDAEMIENILSAEHNFGDKIALVLNSAGGLGLAAERIVNVCRSYSQGKFEAIVPHMAKSAATLICFGASCIRMSPTSELGPVDPQVPYLDDNGKEKWISAEEYVSSYDDLIKKATSGKTERIEALLQQLTRYDSRQIEQLKSAQALSGNISIKLLKSGMMSTLKESDIKRRINNFLLHKQTSSHGRMITMEEAKSCGLNVEKLELCSELWNLIWELYIRANWVVSSRARKLIETKETSVNISNN